MSWRRKIKTALLGTMAAVLAFSTATADIASDLKDAYNDILINANNPKVIEGQERGYITLGSLYYRVPQSNLQLLTITPPRIRAGCSGIDFTAGALSYLNLDQLVSWLQSILQAAPAIAFELALEKYLPGVKSVLNEVSQLAQTVNQMNLNSCEAARKLVHTILDPALKEQEKDKQMAADQNTLSGAVSDFFASVNKVTKDFANALNDFFSTPAGAEREEQIKQARGDYLYKSFEKKYGENFDKKSSMAMAAMEYRLLASLIGDVVLTRPGTASSSSEDSTLYQVKYYQPLIKDINYLLHAPPTGEAAIYDIVDISDSMGTFRGISDSAKEDLYTVMQNFCKQVVPPDYASYCDSDPGFSTIVYVNMKDIYNRIVKHQPLSDEEKLFVSATPLPILKWLNVLSYYPTVAETFMSASKDYIASLYLQAILSDALRQVTPLPWKDLSQAQKEDIDKLYQVAVQRMKELEAVKSNKKDFFLTYNQLADFINHYEKALVTRLANQHIYTNL
jgi:hypothetical protein